MQVTLEQILAMGLGVLSLLGFFFGIIRYIQARFDAIKSDKDLSIEKLRQESSAKVAELHARIDATRNEYARRDDLNSHLTRIEGSLSSMHRRLDNLFERNMRDDKN